MATKLSDRNEVHSGVGGRYVLCELRQKGCVGGADVLALGKQTMIPCVVGDSLMQGLLAWRKCPMHHVSAMMVSLVGLSEASVETGAIGSIA
jgi:hypothetical protein